MEEDHGSEDGHKDDMTPEELRHLAMDMDHDELLSMEHAEPCSSFSAVPRAPAPAVADGMTPDGPDELGCVAMDTEEAPSTAAAASGKPRRSVSGPRALKILQSIVKLQKSLQIPQQAFANLCLDIAGQQCAGIQLSEGALQALQHVAEEYITETLVDAGACALHARRVTLKSADFALLKKLRREL